MKKNHLQKLNCPSIKQVKKRLDILWSKKIRSIGKCEYCYSQSRVLHAHHIFSRANLGTRWDYKNGVCLCAYHHRFMAHQDPETFRDWLITKRGQDDFDFLKIKAHYPTKYSVSDLLLLEIAMKGEADEKN